MNNQQAAYGSETAAPYGSDTVVPLYGKGHNEAPPDPVADPLDEALAPFGDSIAEATNWLDGTRVENEGQHDAVDAILKDIRKAGTAINKAEKAYVAPRHKAWTDAKAKWAPTIKDLKLQKDGLAKLVSDFKVKLAAEKEEVRRLANMAAKKLADKALAKIAAADKANIEEVREAEVAVQVAKDAKKVSSAANRDTVKGLRVVHKFEIEDYAKAINDIRVNDKAALVAFIDDYVRRNRKDRRIDGVRVWQTQEAY